MKQKCGTTETSSNTFFFCTLKVYVQDNCLSVDVQYFSTFGSVDKFMNDGIGMDMKFTPHLFFENTKLLSFGCLLNNLKLGA